MRIFDGRSPNIVDDLSGNLNADQVTVVVDKEERPGEGPGYAIVHYLRTDDDCGDHTTGDHNDFWGLHTWTGAANPLD